MLIGIGIPCADRVHPDFMMNLLEVVRGTKHKVIVRKETGVRTDRNRNVLLQQFLKDKVDYILWLDADMIFPANIIDTYLAVKADIIGCLYFRRERPHTPIGYTDSGKKDKPYKPILPQLVHFGNVYPVTGLGFGGMMVDINVYRKLKKQKWMNYGRYFHIPEDERGTNQKHQGLTHDLEFCKIAIANGFKLQLHGSIRPSHIGDKFVTEEDYQVEDNIEFLRSPKSLVILVDGTEETAELLRKRAGITCEILMVKDKKKHGFIKTVSDCIKRVDNFELYIPVDNNVVPKKDWLLEAIVCQATTGAGLVALNDSFCMIEGKWVKWQKCDFKDLEKEAKRQKRFAFAGKAIMLCK